MSLEPNEAELLRTVIDSKLADVHTSIPGRVVSYDSAKQTADIEIVILRAEQAESGATVHETYPVIPNVPVGWPSGGGYSLQFPLEAGDGVWLIFSEAATAQWRETGDISPPGDLDRFDISYPIALPCARPNSKPLPAGTGALLTVPSGGSFAVSTAGGVPESVAIASKVEAELNAIKTTLGSLGGGGAAFAIPYTNVPDVASANLKAQ